MNSVIPIIEGKIGDGGRAAGDVPLHNIDHPTDSTIASGSLDLFYGARPEQLNRRVIFQAWNLAGVRCIAYRICHA